MNKNKNSSLAIVILAAGAASRFGSVKQLAVHQNKTLLQHKIDTCCQLNQYDSYVVLGAAYQQIIAATDFGNCQVIHNIHWHSGMSSSIKAAITELGHLYDGILFLAADQVLVEYKKLAKLIQCWLKYPTKLITAKFDNQIAIPSIFPKQYFHELLALSGDKGGKKVLMAHQENLMCIDLPEAKYDIDRPEDLYKIT
ncbi:nucleotidyltransferase family protein [Pseudoalteromonas sp. NBT06-2]|uniref:nucleotidyltransferase family protein n=1 Tax=Pseudoalteromonas sp. NBT06-2 TaxID=2025950 RepID=UPI0014827497|nr:nucleotidyltransferase family protein [Pseudoalteromonas sp. NBT06-2]